MAINRLKFNSINVTPAADEAIRFNSSANGLETASAGGNLVKIASTTASSSASVSFTSGLTSTYKEYIFYFNNIHPATDGANFTFNFSSDGGSNYNVTKTTTFFRANHNENDAAASINYRTGEDLAQSTSYQKLNLGTNNDADSACSGIFHLYEPSSTTFVKHFTARISDAFDEPSITDCFIAGYGNTTSAIDAIDFKFNSGNVDSGTITMYGVL